MDDLIVEPARPADLPGLLELYAEFHPENPPPAPDKAEAIWTRLIGAEGTTVIVARTGEALVGTCTLTIVPSLARGGRAYALIENVVTRSSHRRRGVGRAVLAAAVRRAWDAGCYKVMLSTGSKREEALRFYESAGFAKGTKTHFEVRRP
jgi:GNAT superfamily N-acetyltransferase